MQGGPSLPLNLQHPQQPSTPFGKTEAQPRYGGLLEGNSLQQDIMPKFDFSHCVLPKFEPKFEVSAV
jgi:hypothetical protein